MKILKTKNKATALFVFFAFGFVSEIPAQSLTLDKAIELTLSNNFQIKIAENSSEIASNNAGVGAAGELPSVSLGAGANGALTNTKLIFAGGNPPIDQNGAQSTTLSADATLNYTLFNGFQISNTKDKLHLQTETAKIQERLQVEQILTSLIQAYFQGLQLQKNLEVAKENLSISQRRYERSKLRVDFGSSNSIEMLNARVDLQNDSIAVLNISQQLQNQHRRLQYLMGQKAKDRFWENLSESFEIQENLQREEIQRRALEENAALLMARAELQISEKEIDIAKSGRYPRLSLSTAYSFSNNENDASFILENRSSGLNGGLNLNYNLFNGNSVKRSIKNAALQNSNAILSVEDSQEKLKTDLDQAFTSYRNALDIIELRKTAVKVNEKNFLRAESLFRNGAINGTQFREAQVNKVNAEIQLSLSRISAKLAEYELLRASGQLIE